MRVLKPAAFARGAGAGYAREPALLAALAARGLPVPGHAAAVRGADGRLLAVAHDYVAGVTADALGRAARGRLADSAGALLAALHAVPASEARALGVPGIDLGEELYRPMIEACGPRLGPRGRDWIERRFARFLADGGSRAAPRVPVHGDLACGHLLAAAAGGIAGVIDWADALVADPAYDLAALIAGCPRGFAERAIARYEAAAPPDPGRRRRAAFYADALPVWQVRHGGEAERRAGARRLAARAAAEARAARDPAIAGRGGTARPRVRDEQRTDRRQPERPAPVREPQEASAPDPPPDAGSAGQAAERILGDGNG